MRTFNRIRKQVEDRGKRTYRGSITVGLHDVQVYLLELKSFYVAVYAAAVDAGQLSDREKNLLAAGEQFEESVKQWLDGNRDWSRAGSTTKAR